MAPVYVLLAIIAIWLLYRFLAGSKTKHPRPEYAIEFGVEEHRVAAEKDAWEGSFWEVATPFPIQARLKFSYRDGDGKRTRRTVQVRRFGDFNDTTLLIGHCLLRDATRTFRTDRIRNCVDEHSGEIVSDVPGYLKAKYERSPERTKEKFIADQYDTMRVLVFLGKADGQFRADEKAIVRDLCVAVSKNPLVTDAMVEDLLGDIGPVSLQAFRLAVGRLSKRDNDFRARALDATEKMVRTQKTVHPSEQDALNYIRQRFASTT